MLSFRPDRKELTNMRVILNNLAFILFPSSLIMLGWSTLGISENPANRSDTYGLPPISIYFVILTALGALSIFIAGVGRLLEWRLAPNGWLAVALRIICYSPLLFTTFMCILVSATYIPNLALTIFTCALLLTSLLSTFLWFHQRQMKA